MAILVLRSTAHAKYQSPNTSSPRSSEALYDSYTKPRIVAAHFLLPRCARVVTDFFGCDFGCFQTIQRAIDQVGQQFLSFLHNGIYLGFVNPRAFDNNRC